MAVSAVVRMVSSLLNFVLLCCFTQIVSVAEALRYLYVLTGRSCIC